MANLNETECECMGIYNAAIGGCDPAAPEVACPEGGQSWLQTIICKSWLDKGNK